MQKIMWVFVLFGAIYAQLLNAENLANDLGDSPKKGESRVESSVDSGESSESSAKSRVDSAESSESNAESTADSSDSSGESSAESTTDSPDSLESNAKSTTDLLQTDSLTNAYDPEFPDYDDDSDLLKSLIERFSMHNENYFLPLYYQTQIFDSPYDKPYKKFEVKLQISAKASIVKDLFWGVGAYFAYTQKSFFQMYSKSISSPFRSTDYNPELIIYKPFDFGLLVRFGYRHLSNGDAGEKSRSMNLVALDLVYRISDFRATLKSWAYIDKDPPNIHKYIGYSDLILEYSFLRRNHLRLTIGNLIHNYKSYKGNVKLEYRFDIRHFGIFVQYFYGYGDNLHEYDMKKHAIGVGFAIATSKTK